MPENLNPHLVQCLQNRVAGPPPVWFMRQAGRHLPEYRELRNRFTSFLEFCLSPNAAAQATLQPMWRYDVDAAIIFSDLPLLPYGLGYNVSYTSKGAPWVEPIANASEIRNINSRTLTQKLAPVFEAIGSVRAQLPKDKALIGFAGAPWTTACYMLSGHPGPTASSARVWQYQHLDAFSDLIEVLVEACEVFLCKQIEAGAHIVQIFDTLAGTLPAALCQQWCLEPLERIVRSLKQKHPSIPIIAFPKGIGVQYLSFSRIEELDCLTIDSSVPLEWAIQNMCDHVCLQGNLDPALLIAGGPSLKNSVNRILASTNSHRFVFSCGDGILPETSPELVHATISQVRKSVSD